MQEFSDFIKRSKLGIMGIKEGKEMQTKGMHNVFNKITEENFPNLEKEFPIQVQKTLRIPNRLDQNRTSLQHIIIKTISTDNRDRILKAAKEKK
jgi:hypothetical protein